MPSEPLNAVTLKTDKELEAYNRTFIDIKLEQVDAHNDLKSELINPMMIKVKGKHFFVSDFGDMKIKVFDFEGKLIDEVGNGQGRGPGELNHIVDFYISGDSVWAVDGSQMKISLYSLSEGYIESFYVKFNAMRIIPRKEHNLYTFLSIGRDSLFQTVDKTGNIVDSFGSLIENQLRNSMSLDGWLLKLNLGFIYVPIHASFIYYFDQNNKIERVMSRPDGLGFAQTIERSTGNQRRLMAPTSNIEASSIGSNGSFLYINMKANSDLEEVEKGYSVIDRYDLNSGEYINSFSLPFGSRQVQIKEHRLFTVVKGQLRIYKIEI